MLATAGMHAFATGMEPETSVVILNEADGETSINVKNTDGTISLLHSVIENTPEDKDALVLLTPPVARVEPGETQLVRFLLKSGRSEEHTSELQSLMRISYAVFCLKKKNQYYANLRLKQQYQQKIC